MRSAVVKPPHPFMDKEFDLPCPVLVGLEPEGLHLEKIHKVEIALPEHFS